MNQSDAYQKGFTDPEQPPHVDGSRATYQPGPQAPVYTHGMEVAQGIPVEKRLPCCGLGYGWTLFVLGFFLTIPWYIGAVMLIFVIRKKNYRERPGCFGCLIGAVLITIFIILQLAGVFHFTTYNSNPQ